MSHSDSEDLTEREKDVVEEIIGNKISTEKVETLLDRIKKLNLKNNILKKENKMLKNNNKLLLTMNENLRNNRPPISFPGPVTLTPRKSRFPVGGVRDAIFNHRRGRGYLRRAIKRKFRRRRNEV
tara:strand:+ start:1323 stop:1697 length:375 start_codon:yes stop_codon:yes gene_type:complete